MKYLDSSKLPKFIAENFDDRAPGRLAGVQRHYDSGYHSLVRFFGPDRIDPSDIAINYLSDPYTLADPIIAEFAQEMEKRLTDEGRLYDGPFAMKLADSQMATPAMRWTTRTSFLRLTAGPSETIIVATTRRLRWPTIRWLSAWACVPM